LRNPCRQLNKLQPGLMAATLARDVAGNLKRKAGVMGIVLSGGEVKNGDPIRIEFPSGPHEPLAPI
jgi:MOSC domain-containing protein YiiM